ncbi:PREDICTED: inositol-trisphosphate 3-kinase B-like [Gekko japonicus]|uniref:Kinase n=1 Tax=Gekko japonicus TaxID=146911 RepID=A0ABM1JXW0_GEKJA|nr:PREDICTED: inositol-trisphosphate 3-kinase B-like [Gekko japonicus]
MEGCGSLECVPASPEPESWEVSGAAQDPPDSEAVLCRARGDADGRGTGPPLGIPQSNGQPEPWAPSPREAADPEPPKTVLPPGPPSLPPDRSVSSTSTCSSLAGSSQESDEVFSDLEEKSPSMKRVLRKTKSWKTFFTMVHWSLRRRSSWVQLAGHEGNFKASEKGQILKKFSPVENACLVELMGDVLHPFVPTYHGVVETNGERYIQMDDLLCGLDMPSIMDCKMGTRTYLEEEVNKAGQSPVARRDLYQKMVKVDPLAPTAQEHGQAAVTKPRYMQWRESISSSASLGFRIEGVTIEGGAVQRDFKQIRTKEQIVETFLTFTRNHLDVLGTYLARLESLRQVLKESTFFKTHEVIGSSLLFLHDRKGQASVWMIDFGKTRPAPENIHLSHNVAWTQGNHEDGYLLGLHHLTDTMQGALDAARKHQEEAASIHS